MRAKLKPSSSENDIVTTSQLTSNDSSSASLAASSTSTPNSSSSTPSTASATSTDSTVASASQNKTKKWPSTFSIDHTQIYKGLAIFYMLLHHALDPVIQNRGILSWLADFNFLPHVQRFAKICVAIFALLSGYGMTLSLRKQEKRYQQQVNAGTISPSSNIPFYGYLNRSYTYAARSISKLLTTFWAAYLFTLIITVIMIGGLSSSYPYATIQLPVDALGLANLLGQPTINGPWWYIPAAIFNFLLFPLFYALSKRLPKLSLLFAVAWNITFVFIPRSFYYSYLFYFGVFILGIAVAQLDLVNRFLIPVNDKGKNIKRFVLISLAWVALFLVRHTWLFESPKYYALDGFLALLGVYGIVLVSHLKPLASFFRFMGKYSTDMFLTHAIILRLFSNFMYGNITPNWFPYIISLKILITGIALGLAFHYLRQITRYNKLQKHLAQDEQARIVTSFYLVLTIIVIYAVKRHI